MAQGVLVICEQRDGAFRKVSFEAVSEGRRLADSLGGEVTAVVLGSGIEGFAGELEKYGPDKIMVVDDTALADYTTDAYTNVLAKIVPSVDPLVIILGASAQGKDLAALRNFVFTSLFNVLEMPVTQVPLGLGSRGLPLGVQVAATHGNDHLTIATAMELERLVGGWTPPALFAGS